LAPIKGSGEVLGHWGAQFLSNKENQNHSGIVVRGPAEGDGTDEKSESTGLNMLDSFCSWRDFKKKV